MRLALILLSASALAAGELIAAVLLARLIDLRRTQSGTEGNNEKSRRGTGLPLVGAKCQHQFSFFVMSTKSKSSAYPVTAYAIEGEGQFKPRTLSTNRSDLKPCRELGEKIVKVSIHKVSL